MNKEKTLRIFFAIDFPPEVKVRLANLRDVLRPCCSRGNFTATSNMHLTILYVGEVASIKPFTDQLQELMHELFTLKFDHIGCFPKHGGDVIWVGLNEATSEVSLLQALYEKIIRLCVSAGFTTSQSKYTPHITLGRNIRILDETVIDQLNAMLQASPIEIRIQAVTLMQSHRVEGKLTYTPLDHAVL